MGPARTDDLHGEEPAAKGESAFEDLSAVGPDEPVAQEFQRKAVGRPVVTAQYRHGRRDPGGKQGLLRGRSQPPVGAGADPGVRVVAADLDPDLRGGLRLDAECPGDDLDRQVAGPHVQMREQWTV